MSVIRKKLFGSKNYLSAIHFLYKTSKNLIKTKKANGAYGTERLRKRQEIADRVRNDGVGKVENRMALSRF